MAYIVNGNVISSSDINSTGVFKSKVNIDGMICHIDAADKDSFPTTNAYTNVISDAIHMNGWGSYSNGNDGQFVTEFNTVGYKMINRGSWNGIYKSISLPSTGTYTFSAWYRWYSSGSGNNGATVYVSGFGQGDTATGISQAADKVGVWQRVSHTISASSTSGTFYIISYGGTNGGSNSTWEVTMPMIQSGGSMAGDWINGTNGDAVIDMSQSGNSVIKNSNTTWNSNYGGAFMFNGSNSALDFNTYFSELSGLNPWTIEVWYKRMSTNTGVLISNYGPGYGNGIWMFSGGVYIQGDAYEADYGASYNNTVYQLTCSRDKNGVVRVYRNANLTKSTVLTGSVPANINWRIGLDVNGTSEPFYGEIYIVRIYNRVLNSFEIAENFQATRGRFSI